MVAVRAADLRSPLRRPLREGDRTALTAAGGEKIRTGNLDAGSPSDREDRVEHLSQLVRIQRQHVSLAAQVAQRTLHLT